MAASATLALKAGACVRRVRFVIVAPDPRHSRRSQAGFPLNELSEFGRPPLSEVFGWYDIPHDSTEIAGGRLHRTVYQQWGFDAAATNNVPLAQFPRRIFFF